MPRTSLIAYFQEFSRHGRGIALVEKRGYRHERWSYAELAETATRLAAELAARGVASGDRVLIWGENSGAWVAAFWGTLLRGAIAVPMDAAATAEFAGRVAQQAGVKLAIVSRDRQALVSAPSLALEEVKAATERHSIEAGRAAFAREETGRKSIAQIVFTSGTTAEPRGVAITHGNILANIEPLERGILAYRKYEQFFHPVRFLNLLPLSHVFGQFLGIFVPPLLGATVVFEPSPNPSEAMRTIRRERVTVLVAVPRMMDSLKHKIERDLEAAGRKAWFDAAFAGADGRKFLRRAWIFRRIHRRFGWKFWAFISGGAALSPATEMFWSRLGYAMIQGYGLTETTSLVSVNHPFRIGRGSIGKILPGREIRLDENGEILVRGENIAVGYWEGGQVKPGGDGEWFRTGDIGALDAEGNLYFKGRKKNVIVTPAGMNVYPEDLEAAVRADVRVKDCVVVGLESDGNAEPCAVLILKEAGADARGVAASVVERANASLAEYQRMRAWRLWPEEDFPRTSTGKPRTNLISEAVGRRAAAETGEPSRAAAPEPRRTVLEELVGRVASRLPGNAPRGAVSAGADLEADLGLSSLDRVELMSAIEERFQIDLNETQFSGAKTVANIERLLGSAAARRSDFHYPRWTQRAAIRWLRLAVYYLLVWPATHLLAHPRVRGRENLRGVRGPVLVVSNHVTRRADIGFVLAALPLRFRHRLATAMGGETLENMRRPPREWLFFRRWIYQLGYRLAVALFNAFPLPRESGFRESFQFAGASVDRGYSVLVFPEGESTRDGRLAAFRTGIGLLANNLGIPVVPMRIDGLWEVRQSGRRFARPGKVRVTIGAAVRFAPDRPAEEIARELEDRVRNL